MILMNTNFKKHPVPTNPKKSTSTTHLPTVSVIDPIRLEPMTHQLRVPTKRKKSISSSASAIRSDPKSITRNPTLTQHQEPTKAKNLPSLMLLPIPSAPKSTCVSPATRRRPMHTPQRCPTPMPATLLA